DGSVYTPWLDGDAFRIRRYAAPCQTTDVRSVGVQRPSHFGLVASPNPFNPSTNIRFSLDRTGPVRLAVYNLAGQLLETLVEDTLPGGDHRVQWRAGTSASGLYLLRIDGPGPGGRQSEVQRILLVR
ncbi:MAG: T9SS type A sorting domain-containing protein, partial [Candidatus Cloacimonetes bacterium]|nr:T9SS type A sorting domain-containing protein [Candidatus Cloacimonadota bacterium]